MNIYEFINSKAIREHCKKISHKFNTVEAAFLVWQSENHTMTEKLSAWQEIVDTMPDMEIEERPWTSHFESAHDFIRKYINLVQNTLEDFNAQGEIMGIRQFLDDEDDEAVGTAFEGMWLDIPVPFKTGDIVCCKSLYSPMDPFVLKTTNNQPDRKFPQENIDSLFKKRGDITDMGCCGYAVGDDGQIYFTHGGFYPNLDYYENETAEQLDSERGDKERMLYWLSEYLKGTIDLDVFLLFQEKIRLDKKARELNYADEMMQMLKRKIDGR